MSCCKCKYLSTHAQTCAHTLSRLISQVKKDASMLDAFGKGASEDIQDAKDLVYKVCEKGTHTGLACMPECL